MSMETVVAFVKRSDTDPELKRTLEGVHGRDAVVRVAADHGFSFTRAELDPVVSLLGFLDEAKSEPDLARAVVEAESPEAVIRLGRDRGYAFTAEVMAHVDISMPAATELSEDALEEVVGGLGTLDTSGLRVTLVGTRTPSDSSFSEELKSGLSKSGDIMMSAGGIAAPFVPGGSVLSAAISGIGSLGGSTGG